MRELRFKRAGRLEWFERPAPEVVEPTDAIVRPIVAGRCDGDTVPLHRPVSRAMRVGIAARAIDPVVACICGKVPFRGPFAIGHECIGQVTAVGAQCSTVSVGQTVVVPWAVSCGQCERCRAGLTSKCSTTTGPGGELAAYGFGAACGPWGGMVSDLVRVPHADHMLVQVPADVPLERVAAASDNLADAWRATVEPLHVRPGAHVLVLGGGAKSIGLYAAGLAALSGAASVDYRDVDADRCAVAESFGARTGSPDELLGTYDVAVEATSSASGLRTALRALAPGGICTAVGYYLATGTRVPLMRMYATDATLRLGVSHARAILPALLAFIAKTGFQAERVTSLTAGWDEAPDAYLARTTKLVLVRDPLPTP